MNLHDITPPLPTVLAIAVHVRIRPVTALADALHHRTGRIVRYERGMWVVQLDDQLQDFDLIHVFDLEVDIIP